MKTCLIVFACLIAIAISDDAEDRKKEIIEVSRITFDAVCADSSKMDNGKLKESNDCFMSKGEVRLRFLFRSVNCLSTEIRIERRVGEN